LTDVILVKLEGEEQSLTAPPFGVLYLADSLEKASFSVRVIHELGSEENILDLTNLVSKEKPLLVGFSTLTGLALLPTLKASMAIKQTLPVPVVWGGLHPTMLPEQTLMNDCIDMACIGEGEQSIVELARVLRRHGQGAGELADIAGIAFKQDGRVVRTEPRPFVQDLDGFHPAWHHVDVARYFPSGKHFYVDQGLQISGDKVGAIITSRGCPWRCGFCYNQFVNKRTFRAHSAGRIINDIRSFKERHGITAIAFEDDYFFADKGRALEIIRHIDMPWSSNVRANQMAKWGAEFARELSSYHCAELRIGAESGSQRVLDIMNKDITVDQIRRSVELCVRYGIPATLGFMLGIPGETWSDALATLELMDELEGMSDNVRTLGPGVFMPYPGTPMFDLAMERGFKPPTSLDEWSVSFWGPKQPLAPYADKRIRFINHYKGLVSRTDLSHLRLSLPTRVLRCLARLRWRYRFFFFPIDYTLPVAFLNKLTELGLGDTYGKLRKAMWRS
jgi:anaerobic magnesium-protoporphyrin IX monomethyl ester cyclase